jgi:CDP-glucose 4,6-dehydratase
MTRCGNFYGGGDLNFNRIIPGTIRSILHKERPVIRSDGTMIRDYFYIEDGAEAYITLAEQIKEKNIEGEAFNFSNEQPLKVTEIVDKVLKIMDSDLKPQILDETSNEIKEQYLSSEKAKKILNWNPSHKMEEGLEKTVKWYETFFNAE